MRRLALLAAAGAAPSLSLQIGADAGREVINFDFAWRVLPLAQQHAFYGNCSLALDKQTSRTACVLGQTYGCQGGSMMAVTGGCKGEFTCDGHKVVCESQNYGTSECRCVPAPPSVPPQALPGYDDGSWQLVDCPHDFLITGNYSADNTKGMGFLARGDAWYRKHFRLPAEWASGSAVWIYIEGSFHTTRAWLNGVEVGSLHMQGYTSFWIRLDSHPGVQWGDAGNVLALYVNASTGTGWWYEGGGLNRHVWLVRTDALHFPPDSSWVHSELHGGTALRTPGKPAAGATATSATVIAATTIRNAMSAAVSGAKVAVSVVDAAGKEVAQGVSSPLSVPAGGSTEVSVSVALDSPELWSVARPYLYTVRMALSDGAGAARDAVNITTGVRSIRFDADTGFYLNEQPVKIRGFCDHSSFAGVGAAVPDRINLFRAQVLRSVGGNGWRFAHNAPVPVRIDFADRLGVLVMDENRDYGGHQQQGGITDETWEQEVQDMGDLVRRDRSHPSIIIWSFCNEVGCIREYGEKSAKYFRNITYAFDGSRPVTQNHLGTDVSTDYLDVQGLSHKMGPVFDEFHETHPAKPMMSTECCSCLSQRGTDQDFCPNPKDGVTCPGAEYGTFYNNEISQCTATQIAASDSRPFVAGTFVWSGFDYYGESRGFPQTAKCRGAIADVAGFAKETSYWLRAWWLSNISSSDHGRPPLPESTTVYFPETWRTPASGANRTVHVYSNAPRVSLWLNGRLVGSQDMPFFGTATFSVKYEPGNLTATAEGQGGGLLAAFTKMTPSVGRSLRLSLDAPSASTGTGSAVVADGEDVAMLRAEVLDADGRLAVDSNVSITFAVTQGPGRLWATHNGDPANQQAPHGATHTAYHGLARAIVRTTVDAATPLWHRRRVRYIDADGGRLTRIAPDAAPVSTTITVRATAPGLPAAQLDIPVSSDLADSPLAVAAGLPSPADVH
eukprot:TRINITY_DN4338_c0_g1_i1.p1 TRINITY_DN4338_c0_g1~~TRINITY_DN4338_c0_g1_i1.p1  ORF type:complete len:979 (+),score=225.56 TRINITY_DN4338_c0_g1_i1:75-2939(+)